jgi:hypothetical protein
VYAVFCMRHAPRATSACTLHLVCGTNSAAEHRHEKLGSQDKGKSFTAHDSSVVAQQAHGCARSLAQKRPGSAHGRPISLAYDRARPFINHPFGHPLINSPRKSNRAAQSSLVRGSDEQERRTGPRAVGLQIFEPETHCPVFEAIRRDEPPAQRHPLSVSHVDAEFLREPRWIEFERASQGSAQPRQARAAPRFWS